jgi:hypothetical protein
MERGVLIGAGVAAWTSPYRTARALLLSKVVWLLALAVVAVLPAHGAEHRWINPTLASRFIWAELQNGRSYENALNDTEPFMDRELAEATNACVEEQPRVCPVSRLHGRSWLVGGIQPSRGCRRLP